MGERRGDFILNFLVGLRLRKAQVCPDFLGNLGTPPSKVSIHFFSFMKEGNPDTCCDVDEPGLALC